MATPIATLDYVLFEDLGINVDAIIELSSDWTTVVKDLPINPKFCGPIGCIFQDIRVTVQAGVAKGNLYLKYDFRWNHENCGGSNGYDLNKTITL